jgi:hypothetical protein
VFGTPGISRELRLFTERQTHLELRPPDCVRYECVPPFSAFRAFVCAVMTTTQAEALRAACRCLAGDLFCIALPWLLNEGERMQELWKRGKGQYQLQYCTVRGQK